MVGILMHKIQSNYAVLNYTNANMPSKMKP